jgi:hypothetical protein
MTNENSIADPSAEGAPSPVLSDRETLQLVRRIAAEADEGRSSYTTGMLLVATITCAAILGVCGTTLQNLLTVDDFQEVLPTLIVGLVYGIPVGGIVALFVNVKVQTIFLGCMMGGLISAIATPAVLYAERSPTAALATAVVVGPIMILGSSALFSRLSFRRSREKTVVKTPKSPWDEPEEGDGAS